VTFNLRFGAFSRANGGQNKIEEYREFFFQFFLNSAVKEKGVFNIRLMDSFEKILKVKRAFSFHFKRREGGRGWKGQYA